MHKQQGWPQAWEYCQAKLIQTLGRASQGVNWSWSECIKSNHAQISSGKELPSHFWNRNIFRSILPGLRRKWTGLLLSGRKSSFQMKVHFAFNLEIKFPESGGRVERHRIHVSWSPGWSFHRQWWFWVPWRLLVLVHCISSQENHIQTISYRNRVFIILYNLRWLLSCLFLLCKSLNMYALADTHVVCDVTTASPFLSGQEYIPSIIHISKRIYLNFCLSIYTLGGRGTLKVAQKTRNPWLCNFSHDCIFKIAHGHLCRYPGNTGSLYPHHTIIDNLPCCNDRKKLVSNLITWFISIKNMNTYYFFRLIACVNIDTP